MSIPGCGVSVPLAGTYLSMWLLMSWVPTFHVLWHVTLCSTSQNAHVAWVHSPLAMAGSQFSAFHPGQQEHHVAVYHSCLWALAWLHCIPVLPPLHPRQGNLPLSGPPCKGRINQILSKQKKLKGTTEHVLIVDPLSRCPRPIPFLGLWYCFVDSFQPEDQNIPMPLIFFVLLRFFLFFFF